MKSWIGLARVVWALCIVPETRGWIVRRNQGRVTRMAADPNAHARLRREAMAAAALDHPYICKIFEIAEDGDTLFFVMELIAGETLHNHLLNNRMSVSETLHVAGEIAEVMQEAHAGRFLHRDLSSFGQTTNAQSRSCRPQGPASSTSRRRLEREPVSVYLADAPSISL